MIRRRLGGGIRCEGGAGIISGIRGVSRILFCTAGDHPIARREGGGRKLGRRVGSVFLTPDICAQGIFALEFILAEFRGPPDFVHVEKPVLIVVSTTPLVKRARRIIRRGGYFLSCRVDIFRVGRRSRTHADFSRVGTESRRAGKVESMVVRVAGHPPDVLRGTGDNPAIPSNDSNNLSGFLELPQIALRDRGVGINAGRAVLRGSDSAGSGNRQVETALDINIPGWLDFQRGSPGRKAAAPGDRTSFVKSHRPLGWNARGIEGGGIVHHRDTGSRCATDPLARGDRVVFKKL